MQQICAKVYYNIADGEVLAVTGEMQGYVRETTKAEDMQSYSQLKDKCSEDIDYITLEYGTLASAFSKTKSYSVNIVTKALEVVYYTDEELAVIEKGQQTSSNNQVNDSIATINEYLCNSDPATIADIENAILQIELNKSLGGM